MSRCGVTGQASTTRVGQGQTGSAEDLGSGGVVPSFLLLPFPGRTGRGGAIQHVPLPALRPLSCHIVRLLHGLAGFSDGHRSCHAVERIDLPDVAYAILLDDLLQQRYLLGCDDSAGTLICRSPGQCRIAAGSVKLIAEGGGAARLDRGKQIAFVHIESIAKGVPGGDTLCILDVHPLSGRRIGLAQFLAAVGIAPVGRAVTVGPRKRLVDARPGDCPGNQRPRVVPGRVYSIESRNPLPVLSGILQP